MSTDLDERTERTPAQRVIAQIRSDSFRDQIAVALPGNLAAERFARVAVTALQQNPELAQANPDSVLRSLIRCAQDGLLPDGREAALVVYNVRDQGATAQYLPMVGGLRKIAAEHGWTLRARAVYHGDEFDWTEQPPTLTHRQARPGTPRGDLIAAYAIAAHRDGRSLQRVMLLEDINRRKAKARTDKVWREWPAEMAEKTVAKDLFAELPLSGDDLERVNRVIAADLEPGDATAMLYGPPARPSLPAPPRAADANRGTTRELTATSPPTGEPADGDTSQQTAPAAGQQPPSAAGAAPGDVLDDEPGPHDEPSPSQPPTGASGDDAAVYQAEQAAKVVVPIGKWKGSTLAEVHGAGESGAKWLRYALASFDEGTGTGGNAEPRLRPGELLGAIRAFCAVFAPELIEGQAAA